MQRTYAIASWFFTCLAASLGIVAVLTVSPAALADTGLVKCLCAPGDNDCLQQCCLDACGEDATCFANCCENNCNGDSNCVSNCTNFTYINCGVATPDCSIHEEDTCSGGCTGNTKCACRWRPRNGTYTCVCIQVRV